MIIPRFEDNFDSLVGADRPICTEADAAKDRSYQLLAVTFPLFVLVVIAVGLRLWCRRHSRTRLWYDDWLIVASLVLCTAYDFSVIPLYIHGFGKSLVCAAPHVMVVYKKTMFAWGFLYTLILASVKYSILLFLYRLFGITSFKIYFWILWVLVSVWTVAVMIGLGLHCVPADAFWTDKPGKCFDIQTFFIGNAVPNIVTDILLLLVPIPWVVQLKLKRAIRATLVAVFGCGALVIVASSVRLRVLLGEVDGRDPTVTNLPEVIWTVVEVNVAIISACLPSLSALLKHFLYKKEKPVPARPDTAGRRPSVRLPSALTSFSFSAGERTLQGSEKSMVPGNDGITIRRDVSVYCEEDDGEPGKNTYQFIIEASGEKPSNSTESSFDSDRSRP